MGVGVDNEAVARDAVRRYARSGFYDADEIAEIITELLFWQGEIDPGWLRGEIEQALRWKRAQEKAWPEVTDCDRLDAAFESLKENGVLALQNAGYTLSDGLDDVAQAYHEAGGERSEFDGYCFYQGQDLERVIESGELWLAFGAIDGDDAKGEEIGRRINGVLEAAGFAVEWSGSVQTRLLVKGIKWQRRGGQDAERGAAPDRPRD